MKTKIPTFNFLTDTISKHSVKPIIPDIRASLPTVQSTLYPAYFTEGHMLLICIQDVKRLFVPKTRIF